MGLVAGGATDVGMVRATNQDCLLTDDTHRLYAVADGMGGHAAGEVASATAIAALDEAYTATGEPGVAALGRAVAEANRRVFAQAQTDPALHGMGTTLVAVALVQGSAGPALAVANVGDSRAYRLRGGELDQLTVDHSLVAELVAQGRLAPDEAEFHPQRNVLTRALGVDPDVAVDVFEVDPVGGDRLLLCSDGLTREVSDSAVASILRRHRDPAAAAAELVSEARLSGGSDNITVVVVDVVDDDAHHAVGAPVDDPEPTAVVAPPEPAEAAEAADATVAVPVITSTPAPSVAATRPAPLPVPRRPRAVTFRVVAFAIALLVVLGAGAAGVALYARGTYFVGTGAAGQVVIYQGRPGGVLWLQPTVAATTGHTVDQLAPSYQPAVRAGMPEASVAAGQAFVTRALDAPGGSQAAAPTTTAPPTTAPPTTAPPTTAPTTSAPATTAPATTGPPTSVAS